MRLVAFPEPPTVLAHRGYGRGVVDGFAENTLDAFLAAIDRGVDWVEVDVRRDADDRLWVLHHPTTPDGVFVAEQSSAQLAGTALALDDLLAALPGGIGVCFDIKSALEDAVSPAPRTTAGLMVPVLRRIRGQRPLLATSFDPAALLHIGAAVPGVPRGLLTWVAFPLRKAIPAAAHLGVDVLVTHWRSLGPNETDPAPVHRDPAHSIDVAHRSGLQVVAWCPPPDRLASLLAAGLDAVVVDDIPASLAVCAARRDGSISAGAAPTGDSDGTGGEA